MSDQKEFKAGSVQNLLLFQKFYDFDTYIEPIIERFPNYEKSAWCAELKRLIIRTFELIIITNRSRNKIQGWYQVDTNLELLRIFLRRMREKKYLSIKSYNRSAVLLVEIGKILGGLINKSFKNNGGG